MSHLPPVVRPPTEAQLRDIAARYYFGLDDEEVAEYRDLIEEKLGFCTRIDELARQEGPRWPGGRDPGGRATDAEDPHNAVVTYCEVEGADDGPLSGYAVGVKDNIAVADVEMTSGSKVMAGYRPRHDATVVTRLLAAGATITAKTNMDEMAVSGSGEPGLGGPIINPRREDHLAGGSSGGSAVAVVTGDVEGARIGVLREGFEVGATEEAVDDGVWAAVEEFEALGADAEAVSIPWHEDGLFVWLAVENEAVAAMWDAESTGHFVGGRDDADRAQAFAKARRAGADEFAPTVTLKCLLGRYLSEQFHGRYHDLGQNLRSDLRAAYDDALETYDALLMPTTPVTAFEREPELTRTELINRAQGKEGRTRNTMPFNMTGHPAISVPCGVTEAGLPIGAMLVGRHGEEETILRLADAFERATDLAERSY